ncbi:hypothetical protein LYZ90_22400, partial [Xanthomonas hortorum pv. vitians]|nr:hypothetical protein [Xanthomonas hortorum pv. vitians]MCE4535632.1 hypothetical protein [Xanthomonas hortorum pv. vitians]
MVYRAVVEFCNDSIDLARDPYSRVHSSSVRIVPFDAPLGAEVIGFDLSQPLDADTFARIHLSASRKIDPAITRGLRHTSHQGDHHAQEQVHREPDRRHAEAG